MVSREHITKGLTCQAQELEHDLNSRESLKGIKQAGGTPMEGVWRVLNVSCVPLGLHQPRDCIIVEEIPAAASVLKVAWQGPDLGSRGRHSGGRVCRRRTGCEKVLNQGAARQEETERRHRKAGSLTGSLGDSVSELILNVKGKWGLHGERGGGEEAGLRSYLDSWLSSEPFRAGASKPSALPCTRAHVGYTHKVAMHYSGGIACSAPLARALATWVPPSPKAHC